MGKTMRYNNDADLERDGLRMSKVPSRSPTVCASPAVGPVPSPGAIAGRLPRVVGRLLCNVGRLPSAGAPPHTGRSPRRVRGPGLVRLRASVHREWKFLTGGASRRVTESNCVVATRGGEQLEVNG